MITHAIAIDDGNAQFNIISETTRRKFDTTIQRGAVSQSIALVDDSEDSGNGIISLRTVAGDVYSIGAVENPIERHDNFGFTDGGKILIQHALTLTNEFDKGSDKDGIVLCTGLPLRMFYKSDGTMNADNINAKIKAVKDSFDLFDRKNKPVLIQTLVQAEAVAAAYTQTLIRIDGKWQVNPDYKDKTIAVCDPGGKTTDIAIIEKMKVNIDLSSTAENVGMNALIKKAKNFLYDLGFRDCTERMAKEFLDTESLTIRGEKKEFSAWISKQKKLLANKIADELVSAIGSGSRVDSIFMIGGTAKALEKELTEILHELFPNHSIKFLGDFANAEGLHIFTQLFMQNQKL